MCKLTVSYCFSTRVVAIRRRDETGTTIRLRCSRNEEEGVDDDDDDDGGDGGGDDDDLHEIIIE